MFIFYFFILPFTFFIPIMYKKVTMKTYTCLQKRCTVQVTGTCVRKFSRVHSYSRMNSKTGSHKFFFNTWQYWYNGKMYKGVIDEFPELWANEGIQAQLLINPEKPEECILLDTHNSVSSIVSKKCRNNILLGIVIWIIVGIFLLFI